MTPQHYIGSRLYDRWCAFVHRKRRNENRLLVSDSKYSARWVTVDEWLADVPEYARASG